MENEILEQPRQEARFVRILKTVGLVLAVIFINSTPGILFRLHQQLQLSAVYQWPIAAFYFLVVGAVIWALWKGYRSCHQKICQNKRMGWKDIGINVAIAAALRLLLIALSLLNNLYSGNQATGNDMAIYAILDALTAYPAYLIIFRLTIALVTPVIEELVFRGYLTKYFFQTPRNNKIVIISTIVFALLHMADFQNPVEYLLYLSLGLTLYLAYRRRGNIWDAVLVHALNNSFIVLILLFIS